MGEGGEKLSKGWARWVGLREPVAGDRIDAQTETWVWFEHWCEEKKGERDKVGFSNDFGRYGGSYDGCCSVTVPETVWERWRKSGTLQRAVMIARGEAGEVHDGRGDGRGVEGE